MRKTAGNKETVKFLEQFKVTSPSLLNFCGLPKKHKEDVPLRPISSNKGSFSSKLAKWFSGLSSPYIGRFSNSHLKHFQGINNKI